MRIASIILLIVLSCTALLPCMPSLFSARDDSQPAFGTLDVCHSSAPAVAAGGNMPCVNERAVVPVPFYVALAAEPQQQALTHFLLSTQNERPPKA